ncbi:carbohydrate ABC transporter permease [Actinophytocola oryzae]|uniref:Carbohydrate ABC transporter membrane protein 1 (CUT1 family) n=1 Tax=Actinophytocola oryzae TaxID=502181 RepID=A0A4V3FV64_9PSEU|nr:sugar ABC transporter permease [Actinophytocola oryzae]TDV57861.1 carbohydrate ABC transporter membrane protein 1 (CUT1 family) [Actinophytocola oryzae]
MRKSLAPIAWLAMALYATFLLYPVARSAVMSFTNRSPLKPTEAFVGFTNYATLFTDERLLASLRFTVAVVVVVTVVSNVVGLLFAMVLNGPGRNFRVMRTVVFVPQVLSGVVVAFVWRSILNQHGLLNTVLADLGLVDDPVSWLGSTEMATLSICVVVSWTTIAFATVVYTAALRSIPAELYEAARVDGAGAFGRFRHVTLPMIAPGVTISVVLCLITTFKLYDIIAVLTGGGPANTTKSTAYYLVTVAFTNNRFGYASSIAMLLLALTAGVAYGVTTILRRREAHL